MIELDTEIADIGRLEAVRIANFALRWCRATFGVNRRKRIQPVWYIRMAYEDDNTYGEYDATDNEIVIHWNNCETVQLLIETCIHEWTHQNQPILTKYDKYPGSYSRNPYERQARYAEKKWLSPCWTAIQNKINKQL
jgi:hypothetical protein